MDNCGIFKALLDEVEGGSCRDDLNGKEVIGSPVECYKPEEDVRLALGLIDCTS